MTALYEILVAIVGVPPVDAGICGVLLWLVGCVLAVIVPLYAIYYITRIFIDWAR